jgi:ubiquinone/menaquinone biosynthesis C-methylase UbiE
VRQVQVYGGKAPPTQTAASSQQQERIMTNFDERAKDWDSDPAKVERAHAVADAIRKTGLLSRQIKALEYGCGTGLLSFALQSDLGEITLADASQGMLDVLKEKIASVGVRSMHPVWLDLGTDPLPTERYNLIYSLLTLHHIQDVHNILTKFHDLLLPNGYLLAADLDKEDGSFHTDGSTDVHLGFDRDELRKMVEDAGFGNVTFSTAYEITKQLGNEEKTFPVFLMIAQKI